MKIKFEFVTDCQTKRRKRVGNISAVKSVWVNQKAIGNVSFTFTSPDKLFRCIVVIAKKKTQMGEVKIAGVSWCRRCLYDNFWCVRDGKSYYSKKKDFNALGYQVCNCSVILSVSFGSKINK